MKPSLTVFFFSNGNTGVCDENGQMPALQTPWIVTFMEFLESRGFDPLDAVYMLPGGLKAVPYRTPDDSLSWRFE